MTLDLLKAVKFINDFALLSRAAGSLHNSAFVTKVLYYSTEVMKESTSVTERDVCVHAMTPLRAVACELQQGAEFLPKNRLHSCVYVVKYRKRQKKT